MSKNVNCRWFSCDVASIVCLCVFACLQSDAHAQWSPYGGYYSYGGWGGQSATKQMHQDDRLAAQSYTASRNARVGSDIRNTLTNEAQQRSASQINQQQADRDWWLQTQERQTAERRRPASYQPSPIAWSSLEDIAAVPTAQPSEVIAWPRVLRSPSFAAERQRIETPFRRFEQGGDTVTLKEYQMIIDTAAAMRAGLDAMVDQVVAADYLAADRFLTQMADEARGRLQPAAKPSAETGVEPKG